MLLLTALLLLRQGMLLLLKLALFLQQEKLSSLPTMPQLCSAT
jgi:hypothetical protein